MSHSHSVLFDELSPAIEAKDLSKVFGLPRSDTHEEGSRPSDAREARRYKNKVPGQFLAVDGASLRIERGERVGFIGHNGSGKSTLFQLIAGILRPSSGFLKVKGEVGTLLDPSSGFHPEFTGRENLRMAAQLMGLPRKLLNEAISQAADFAEIDLFLDRPLRTYSQGMLLRLAFSLNVMVKPDILLIDEALAVGDLRFQQKCFEFLRSGQAAETLLLISHDLSALTSLVDRIVVLDHGRIIFDGPSREAITAYLRALHSKGSPFQKQAGSGGDSEISLYERDEVLPWIHPEAAQLTGSGKVQLLRLALVDEGDEFPSFVQEGQSLRIEFDLSIPDPEAPLIFGYIVHDRLGQNICGHNSMDKTGAPISVERAGDYRMTLSFMWPALKPGSYTITVGVGEGYHSNTHEILSWAHHVFQIEAVSPGSVVTTLFSNPIQRLALRPK